MNRPKSSPLQFDSSFPSPRVQGLAVEVLDSEGRSSAFHSQIGSHIESIRATFLEANHLCQAQRSVIQRSMGEIKRCLIEIEEIEENHRRQKKLLRDLDRSSEV